MRTVPRLCLLLLLPLLLISCARGSGPSASEAPETTETPSPGSGAAPALGPEITIGYSDWPGWVAWDIVEQQGLFKKHGVNVKLVWFPNYSDSLNAFAAGKVDANCQTWSDSMAPIAQGLPVKVVLVNDNSAGNDALIAKPGIASVKALKGKKVATELGTVDHFLLLKALEANGMTEADIQFVNIKVQDCPAAMLAGRIDAAVVWEPSRSKILADVKGATSLFDSNDVPGLIPDLLVTQAKLVDERAEDVQKIVDAWYEAIDWWKAHPDEAVAIMAKRTSSTEAFYNGFIKGTRIFSAGESLASLTPSAAVSSLHTSGEQIAQFLLQAKQITSAPDYAAVIESRFVAASKEKGLGSAPPYDYGG